MYPGLFRNLNLSASRYNQHVSDGAFIVEVGATGNTIEEAKASMKYFASEGSEINLKDILQSVSNPFLLLFIGIVLYYSRRKNTSFFNILKDNL